MDPTPFLTRPQNYISIISWNINSVRTKLEKQNVYNLISQYDIISLNEIKTPFRARKNKVKKSFVAVVSTGEVVIYLK